MTTISPTRLIDLLESDRYKPVRGELLGPEQFDNDEECFMPLEPISACCLGVTLHAAQLGELMVEPETRAGLETAGVSVSDDFSFLTRSVVGDVCPWMDDILVEDLSPYEHLSSHPATTGQRILAIANDNSELLMPGVPYGLPILVLRNYIARTEEDQS